mmetsp:Transcript_92095/g.214045  ORF Transcript_92095/g.214045 Transcript_92095/m.214045 type:complete len:256 (-) Transcript_92095:135-902(-)
MIEPAEDWWRGLAHVAHGLVLLSRKQPSHDPSLHHSYASQGGGLHLLGALQQHELLRRQLAQDLELLQLENSPQVLRGESPGSGSDRLPAPALGVCPYKRRAVFGALALGRLGAGRQHAPLNLEIPQVGIAAQMQQGQRVQQAKEVRDLPEEVDVHRARALACAVGQLEVRAVDITRRVKRHSHASPIKPLRAHPLHSVEGLPPPLVCKVCAEDHQQPHHVGKQLEGVWIVNEVVFIRDQCIGIRNQAKQQADAS